MLHAAVDSAQGSLGSPTVGNLLRSAVNRAEIPDQRRTSGTGIGARAAPRNRREFEQEMADLPRRERRRLLSLAAMEHDGWQVPLILSRVFFGLALAAPLFLYGVAFILRGTGADWDRIFGETGAPFARAILVFGLLLLAARETAIRFAHPAKRHWERAWEKAADRF